MGVSKIAKQRANNDNPKKPKQENEKKPTKKKKRKAKANKTIGRRNARAVAVVRRIKAKLEGRDGTDSPLSIEEQVDKIIEQAVDPNNLATLFHGWLSHF